MSFLLDRALEYNDAGFSVIFTGNDKRAIGGWKRDQQQRATPDQLRARFKRHERRATGIAIVHGPVSNDVYCRDFDVLDSYEQWSASYPELANTLPTAKSFRAPHVYFKCAETLTTKKCGDGEVRGLGGYTILPPSQHPAGITYSWTIPPDDIPYLNPISAGFFQNWQGAGFDEKAQPSSTQQRAEKDTSTSHPYHFDPLILRTCDPENLCDTDLNVMVAANLPTAEGQNHAKLFALAKQIKAFENNRSAVLTTEDLERAFSAWYDESLSFLRSGQSRDQYFFEFLEAYQDARGDGLANAWARALRATPPTCADRFEDPKAKLLITLLRELQNTARGDHFFLSCRTAGSLLDINNRTAARILKALCALRIIELLQAGTMGRASVYRYVADSEPGGKQ